MKSSYNIMVFKNKLILIQKTVQHPKLLSQANTLGVSGSWLTLAYTTLHYLVSLKEGKEKHSIKIVLAFKVEKDSIRSPLVCQVLNHPKCCHQALLSTTLFGKIYFQPLCTKDDSLIKECKDLCNSKTQTHLLYCGVN